MINDVPHGAVLGRDLIAGPQVSSTMLGQIRRICKRFAADLAFVWLFSLYQRNILLGVVG